MLSIKSITVVAAMLTTMTAWAQALDPKSDNCGATENDSVVCTLSDEDSDGTYDKLSITGTGAMMDFNNYNSSKGIPDNRPWGAYKSDIKTVTVGEGITRIGKHAFRKFCNTELKGITLPRTLTSIADSAFIYSDGIPSITFPSNSELTTIGISAFFQCTKIKITGNALPAGLKTISEYAFRECKSLLLTEIPDGVTTIGKGAFSSCEKLGLTAIPASVTSIGESVFSSCNSIPSFTISKQSQFAKSMFANCKGIQHVTLVSGLTSIPASAFQGCTALSDVTLPASLKTIGNTAFYNCAFSSMTIPSKVTKIEKYAFEYCVNLKSIVVPDNVTSIGDYAFVGCKALESVTLSAKLKSYGTYIFRYCTALKSITIPDNWTMIPAGTFEFCENLEEVVFPSEGVVEIGSAAFSGCKKLTSSKFSIPSSVKTIKSEAFKNCTGLTTITLPDSLEEIPSNMCYGCTNLTSVNLPSTITTIGSFAFKGCSKAFTTIDIPSGVTYLGMDAFNGCKSITSVHIPSTVETIGNSAFYGCSNLSEVTIDEGVETIETYAFLLCNLTSLVLPSTVKELGYSPFGSSDNLATVTLNSNPKFADAKSFPTKSVVTMNIKAKEGENGEYWTTFYNEQVNCLVDENTVIYKTTVSGDYLTLIELTADKIIPKNTPVVLKSNASPIVLTITTTNSKNNVSENSLQGVKEVEGKAADNQTYVLNKKATAGVGFYKLKAGATLGLNKAYLSHESATARDFYSFDDETMGIENMTIIGRTKSLKQEAQTEAVNGNVYDLQGRRVAQPKKGLYVVNGKKVVIK